MDRGTLAELLRRPRYEVVPLAGVEDDVAAHVPHDVKVTVATSPARGIERTLDLVGELTRRGFDAVPHLPARLVVDEEHLKRILERLRKIGVHDLLAIAGDVDEPAGKFAGAFELLVAMSELEHGFDAIGISGYPESHPFITDAQTIEAMFDKAPFATYIVSQLCFEPALIVRWIAAVRTRGTDLPIHIGIPGAVSRSRLLRISAKIGVGESARYLRKQGNVLARLLLRGSYSPGLLLRGLAPLLGGPDEQIGGFHFFTFNELGETERWRQETIRRLDRAAAS